MRSFFVILIISSFIFLNFSVVFAVDDFEKIDSKKYLEEEVKIIEPGVLPSSFWYWADIFSEEIRFLFTVGKETKGDYLIDIAEERLAEMKELSEQGITKHAEKLISRHEESIKKAEKLYTDAKVKGWAEIQKQQTELELEILKQEAQVKKQAKAAPGNYEKGRDGAIARIMSWFREVLGHLKWKKGEIEEQEAAFYE
ncbi:hypothetical protein HQ571_03740 [Candidatus Kuenenbacteria bacterium]|nr:hypothetical protein [Candidatus Kuenenbacteria bacterium]